MTGSSGMSGIISYEVLCHPSDHGTDSMGNHFPPNGQITKVNAVTESEVTEVTSSKVDERALSRPKSQGCIEIPNLSA